MHKNKGEWSEIYLFLKTIINKKLFLANKDLEVSLDSTYFTVSKVTTLNIEEECFLSEGDKVVVRNRVTGEENEVYVSDFLNTSVIKNIASQIKEGKSTFSIPDIDLIQNKLGLSIVKGGNNNQKADIVVDIEKDNENYPNEGFGIKSFLGSKPTLLNASQNTNFVFRVKGINKESIDQINSIDKGNKLKARLELISNLGGGLSFCKVDAPSLMYNLILVDSIMPKLIGKMLLEFYINRTAKINENIRNVFKGHNLSQYPGSDFNCFEIKMKRFLVSALLGFFAGSNWDGKYIANGLIVVKPDGEYVGFHIVELSVLEDYLFENIRFDTPSTGRHHFGQVYTGSDGHLYLKLNLQLRF